MTESDFVDLMRELVEDHEPAERAMAITRALWWVIRACGEKAKHALRAYCQGVRLERKDP